RDCSSSDADGLVSRAILRSLASRLPGEQPVTRSACCISQTSPTWTEGSTSSHPWVHEKCRQWHSERSNGEGSWVVDHGIADAHRGIYGSCSARAAEAKPEQHYAY